MQERCESGLHEPAAERNNLLNLPKAPNSGSPQARNLRQDVLLRLAIEGDLRFISHRDTVRMLQRALVRAALPVAYSQGFNPHIKLSLLVPRPVGVTTEDDLAVVLFAQPCPAPEIHARLRPQMPDGARIVEATLLEPGRKIGLRHLRYELELRPADLEEACAGIREFLDAPSVIIKRQNHKGERKTPLDIRPFVEDLWIDGNRLVMSLRFMDNRTIAPKDLLSALSIAWAQVRHKVCRKKIGWQ